MPYIKYHINNCNDCIYSATEAAHTIAAHTIAALERTEHWYCQEPSMLARYGGRGSRIGSYLNWGEIIEVPRNCPIRAPEEEMPKIGEVLTHMTINAKMYIPIANESISRNSHMNDLGGNTKFTQAELSGILTDYVNFFASKLGVDYGLNSDDLILDSDDTDDTDNNYENFKF